MPPDESMEYFGDEGDRLQMMLNFPVNQRLFYALATGDIDPLIRALEDTRKRPRNAQWVQFLRSHDELDLGRLTDEQRAEGVRRVRARRSGMQLYDRGIRRRLAPMLGNDRRRLELAFSLLFSLPGTPMMQYGDEIGIGDDLSLPERECARTPMQWTAEQARRLLARAGASSGRSIDDPIYGYQRVNVADAAARSAVAAELDGAEDPRCARSVRRSAGATSSILRHRTCPKCSRCATTGKARRS